MIFQQAAKHVSVNGLRIPSIWCIKASRQFASVVRPVSPAAMLINYSRWGKFLTAPHAACLILCVCVCVHWVFISCMADFFPLWRVATYLKFTSAHAPITCSHQSWEKVRIPARMILVWRCGASTRQDPSCFLLYLGMHTNSPLRPNMCVLIIMVRSNCIGCLMMKS